MSISTKITALILLLTLLAVAAIGIFTYDHIQRTHQEKSLAILRSKADTKAAYLNVYFENAVRAITLVKAELDFTSRTNRDTEKFTEPSIIKTETDGSLDHTTDLTEYLKLQQNVFDFEGMYLTSTDGVVVVSSQPARGHLLDPDGHTFQQSQKGVYVSTVFQDSVGYHSFVAGPVNTAEGTQLLIIKLNLNKAFSEFLHQSDIGRSGEMYLTQHNPYLKNISLLTALKDNFVVKAIAEDAPDAAIFRKVSNGTPTAFQTTDFRGNVVWKELRKINHTNVFLVAKIDAAEANGETRSLWYIFLAASLSVITVSALLATVLARSFTMPLNSMKNKLGLVARGILPEATESYNHDEFGQMGQKVNALVETLKRNAEFARKIGEGKYETEFKPLSDQDILGMSLINMRHNLIANENRDVERNRIVRAVAEMSQILRMHDSTERLGQDALVFILERIGAIQGAFYTVQEDDDGEKIISLLTSYAYNRKKYLKGSFRFAEGLIGQAAAEKDVILRTEIPEDYLSITSGILGDQRPTCLLIVPLITNDAVNGVLEFAGFTKFTPSQVHLVQELGLILGRTIFNIRTNERTKRLLAESQAMSQELKEKQSVLRQNAEQMEATQQELKRSNQRLEEQIDVVNHTQKRMQLLLENASEVITIYEENGTIRYISPSVETILGYSQKELIGKTDIEKVHPDHRTIYSELFQRLKENPDEKVTVQFAYHISDAHYIWVESTGANCMSNPAIQGFILNSRDITERRLAEQEQRMRSKMQALSENSPDLIARLEDGLISYINPIIELYTGRPPQDFVNKKATETQLDTSVMASWRSIEEQVNLTQAKVSAEIEFPSEIGKRVMQVNAIPEYDETKKLESVLVVSHDITDRKLIELEIQSKNRKITESINYAKRIQSAILPNARLIDRILPDSFILYKPRDVVSGDFPWFAQVKNEIFIAAVDCTGHGVPGALLSLIGYFLLNDIVRSRKITDPGKILDLLDEGVTATLRQDEDASTKDGMDISLCKIDLAKNEVEYAGAHRPLYIMKNGVMQEIKGNKFPIGGGIFKNQTNFTNSRIKLNKGDSIYFCSDGFPDQFGGPQNRKFGQKKVREIIQNTHTLPMKEAMNIFNEQWESWKGEEKQTDDVILIGIKF